VANVGDSLRRLCSLQHRIYNLLVPNPDVGNRTRRSAIAEKAPCIYGPQVRVRGSDLDSNPDSDSNPNCFRILIRTRIHIQIRIRTRSAIQTAIRTRPVLLLVRRYLAFSADFQLTDILPLKI